MAGFEHDPPNLLSRRGDKGFRARRVFGAALGSDDRMFRLNAADPKDCAL